LRSVILCCFSPFVLFGCASQSGKTFATLDRGHPAFHSSQCQQAIRDNEVHDDLKLARLVGSPVAVILSGGLLLPAVIAANLGFDTADHVDASRMARRCGGAGQEPGEILESVAKGAALGLATGAVVGGAAGPSGAAVK